MNFLKWLGFGRPRVKPTFQAVFSDQQQALIRSLTLPAILLESGGAGFSRLGGLPDMPEELDWPRDERGRPLQFLTQIDLAALPPVSGNIGLPGAGYLWFFWLGGYGFDPNDRLKWRVLFWHGPFEALQPRFAPARLRPVYREVPVIFRDIETWPDSDIPELSGQNFTTFQSEFLYDYASEISGETHRLGGHCDFIQNPDMPLMCQLASNGVYCGEPKNFKTEEAKALSPGAKDWRLLLQLASDGKAKMQWGDGGMLYFWIREDDLKAARFDKVWQIMECY